MDYKLKPWAHQLTAIERASALPWFALFFEMGTGKTGTAINILRAKMMAQKKLLRTLIFCPPIVIQNWAREFEIHTKIDPRLVVPLNGSGKDRLATFQKHAKGPAFFVSNYESLLMAPLFEAMKAWAPEALIFDESHKLKSYKATRSKLAEKLANPKGKPKPLTYLLSGSPVLNSPMDLFHQFLIMDGGATFGKNFLIFRAQYFIDKNAGMPKDRHFPDWVVRPGAVDAINQKIYRTGMRVTKDECLDLPEEVSVTVPCKMTPAQAKNYREMKQDYITFVDTHSASASLAITKALRLMQITSGFLPLAPPLPVPGEEEKALWAVGAKVVYEEAPKLAALRELLEELTPHSKVIVWAVWKENYSMIRKLCEELRVGSVEVHGGISRKEQDANVVRFSHDPGTRVFIGHPGSGGIGINLTCAPYDIFYSRNFSLEQWLQARARNHRGGQTQKVTHYDLVCEGTIDELVQAKVASKHNMSESLLSDISLALRAQAN